MLHEKATYLYDKIVKKEDLEASKDCLEKFKELYEIHLLIFYISSGPI